MIPFIEGIALIKEESFPMEEHIPQMESIRSFQTSSISKLVLAFLDWLHSNRAIALSPAP